MNLDNIDKGVQETRLKFNEIISRKGQFLLGFQNDARLIVILTNQKRDRYQFENGPQERARIELLLIR